MKRIFFTLFLFSLIAFLQTSFFARFSVFGIVPNLLLVAFFLFFLLAKSNPASWFFPALGAGFVLDMSSPRFIGFWPALLFVFGFLVQIVKERYAFLR